MYRKTDPITSRLAAEILYNSKAHSKQQLMIVQALLQASKPMTARELDVFCKQERYFASKRMPELEEAGVVLRNGGKRACLVTNRMSTEWSLYESQ